MTKVRRSVRFWISHFPAQGRQLKIKHFYQCRVAAFPVKGRIRSEPTYSARGFFQPICQFISAARAITCLRSCITYPAIKVSARSGKRLQKRCPFKEISPIWNVAPIMYENDYCVWLPPVEESVASVVGVMNEVPLCNYGNGSTC